MRFIKKIRDDRKGLAIELAMMVMVVTFALSILLTTVALLQVDHSSSAMQDVKRRYDLEQIAEDYITCIKQNKITEFDRTKYSGYDVSASESELIVKANGSDKELLKVVLEAPEGENAVKIIEWELN
jgi:hypothetical protein